MPSESENMNIEIARRYLAALSTRANHTEVAAFFTEDMLQEEFPNRIAPNGARRDRAAALQSNQRGKEVMSAECYEVLNVVANGPRVAMEVQWAGTLAITFGSLAPGTQMRARLAIFLEFRDGQIFKQHNYDCFEPW